MTTYDPSSICIPSNPDISGIGVRIAIYAQNLLSFVPAVFALFDGKVSPIELETLETQSSGILITAFAILVSTVVQARTEGVTNFHVTIILNLSWMNNTNLFIYFLLYVRHRIGLTTQNTTQDTQEEGDSSHELESGSQDPSTDKDKTRSLWLREVCMALRRPVLIIGSLHLSLMAAVGIWLWSKPGSFGKSGICSLSASVIILGNKVQLGSKGLQNWSILVYSLLLTPILNLIIPTIFFAGPSALYSYIKCQNLAHAMTTRAIIVGLILLATIDTLLLVDTELALRRNKTLLGKEEGFWTFGQTLALLLLLLPIRDLSETLLERRPKRVGKRLLQESERGNLETVQYLLEQGPNSQAKALSLVAALKKGYTQISNCLIKHDANVNTRVLSENNCTILHLAAAGGHGDVAKCLIEHGAAVNATDKGKRTPLHWAAASGHSEVGKHLIEHGADVNAKSSSKWTPLHHAAWEDHLEFSKHLLEHGADINAANNDKWTPLHWVATKGYLELGKHLLEHGANVHATSKGNWTPLHYAAREGHLELGKHLIKHGANVHATSSGGWTPLHYAAREGYLELGKHLIEHGAHVYATDNDKWTPLHWAAAKDHPELAKHLIKHGANVNATDIDKWTPLHWAAAKGHPELGKHLIKHGADVNATDTDKWTPLHWAAAKGHLELGKHLIEHGADVHAMSDSKWAPLHYAAGEGHLEFSKHLIEHGADVNAKGRYGRTPQDLSRGSKHKDIADFSAQYNANAKATEEREKTCLV